MKQVVNFGSDERQSIAALDDLRVFVVFEFGELCFDLCLLATHLRLQLDEEVVDFSV